MTLAQLLAESDGAASFQRGSQQHYVTHEMTSKAAPRGCGGAEHGDLGPPQTHPHDEDDSAAADDDMLHLSESPRTVADIDAFLSVRAGLPSPPLVAQKPEKPYREGTVDVTRRAPRRRIRVGSISCPRSATSSSSGRGDGTRTFKLAYRIYRPELLEGGRVPILALHGGPSLPSQYLRPLAALFPDRSVILYDQLGCGKSSSPPDVGGGSGCIYGLSQSVDDLLSLVKSLCLRRFHLLGHSFGGVLAYELCRALAERAGREDIGWRDDPQVLSVILSNAFASAELCDRERGRLLDEMMTSADQEEDDDDVVEEDPEDKFWRLHQCRLPFTPPALEDALNNWGVPWHERDPCPLDSYAASPPSRWASDRLPPALIARGEHDFVTSACVEGWTGLIWRDAASGATEATLPGCAHYPHLEDGAAFGALVEGFCRGRDP